MPVMYTTIRSVLAILGCLIGGESLFAQPVFSDSTLVQAKIWSRDANRNIQYSDWKNFASHTVSQLQGFSATPTDSLDQRGGNQLISLRATGFFRVEKVSGRWQVIDPEGHPFIVAAVNSIRLGNSAANQQTFRERWHNKEAWVGAVSYTHLTLPTKRIV